MPDDQPDDAARRDGDGDGQPLPRTRALGKKDHAEQKIDQRVDAVTKAGFERPPDLDGPDENPPVGRDEDRRDCVERQSAWIAQLAENSSEDAGIRRPAGQQHLRPMTRCANTSAAGTLTRAESKAETSTP